MSGFALPGGPVWAPQAREPAPEPDDSPRRFGHPAEAPTPPLVLAGQALLANPWEALAREAREAREAHEAGVDVPAAFLRTAGALRSSSSSQPSFVDFRWVAARRAAPADEALRLHAGRWVVAAGRATVIRRWRRWVVELSKLRKLRRLTRALTSFLRRRGGGLRWSPRSRLPAEDNEREDVLPLFLRKAFLRWRARARFAQSLGGRRRRPIFSSARRSWWRRVLEDESLRAVAFRVVARLLRWAVSGRGAGPVGAALGAAGTAVLLLEGPAGAGLTEGDAAAAALAPVVHA